MHQRPNFTSTYCRFRLIYHSVLLVGDFSVTVKFREGSFPALSSTRSHAEGTRRMRGRSWHKNSLQRFLITNSAHRIKSTAGYIHRGPAAALIRLKCWHNYKFLPYHELLQWKGRLWGPPLPVGEISTWRELGRTIWTYEDGGYGHTRELSCDLIILVKTGTFIWDQNVRKITHF